MNLAELIEEGKRLDEAASPGPFEVWGEADLPEHDDLCIAAFDVSDPGNKEQPESLYVANVGSNGGKRSAFAPVDAEERWPVSLANARLMAFLLTHRARLLAVAEAAATALGAWDGVSTEEESRLPASFVNAMRQLDAAASGEGRG